MSHPELPRRLSRERGKNGGRARATRRERLLEDLQGRIERLEDRTMLTVSAHAGVLSIIGTSSPEVIQIDFNGDGDLSVSGDAGAGDFQKLKSIVVQGMGGGDALLIRGDQLDRKGLPIPWTVDGGAGSLQIVGDELRLLGTFQTAGDFSISADVVEILPSGLISTRRTNASGQSIANSGSVVLAAPEITINDGVQILADANFGFSGGDVIMRAAGKLELELFDVGPVVSLPDASADITIGSAVIRARSVDLGAESDISKHADLELDESAAQRIVDQYFGKLSQAASTTLTFNDASISISDENSVSLTFVPGASRLSAPDTTVLVFAEANRRNADDSPVLNRRFDTVSRLSGSWTADGFAAGQFIEIRGSESNDGNHQIAAVSADGLTLTLEPGTVLRSEISAFVQVGETDSILRSSGSWPADGFRAGLGIAVSNAPGNNGYHTIASAAADRLRLTRFGDLSADTRGGVEVTDTDTIARSAGSWIQDGFKPGQRIIVSGSLNNDGLFTVLTIDGASLALKAVGDLDDESKSGVEVSQTLVSINDGAPLASLSNPSATSLTFNPADAFLTGPSSTTLIFARGSARLANPAGTTLTFNVASNTITRSTGTWPADGFTVGGAIKITGAGANDGVYTISALSGSVLTLGSSTPLAGNASVGDVEVVGTDTITRSVGDWNLDGFRPGDRVRILGSIHNDGVRRVAAVSAGVIWLSERDALSPNSGSNVLVNELDSISRNVGDWNVDGFRSGLAIVVTGSSNNDGIHDVESVDGATLYLESSGRLNGGTGVGARVEVARPTLSFESDLASNDYILRSSGSWIDDGFQAGQSILIENAGRNDGTRTILSVEHDRLTLLEAGVLFEETVAPTYLFGNVQLTFAVNAAGDAISRSSGSWTADGFKVGQVIEVVGSSLNDGLYLITGVTATVVTVSTANEFLPETSVGVDIGAHADMTEIFSGLKAEDVPLLALDRGGNVIAGAEQTAETALDKLKNVGVLLGQLNRIMPAQAVFADSSSRILLDDGATIVATGDVTIRSTAKSDVAVKSPYLKLPAINGFIGDLGLPVGVGFASVEAEASARVTSGASITAGGLFSLRSETQNNLALEMSTYSGTLLGAKSVLGKFGRLETIASRLPKLAGLVGKGSKSVPARIPAPTLTLAYGRARSDSEATVEAGANVNAGDVFVEAENANSFKASSSSLILFPEKNFGSGLTAAILDTGSESLARLDGTIEADSVSIDAKTVNLENDAFTSIAIKDEVLASGVLTKLGDKIGGGVTAINKDLDTGVDQIQIAASVSINIGQNLAEASIGPNASVVASGDVSVNAFAQDNFRTKADGGAIQEKSKVGLAGAIGFGLYDNAAKASIGDGATVIAGGEVVVKAKAEVPNQISLDDQVLAIIETFRNFQYDPPSFDPVIDFEAPDVDVSAPDIDLGDPSVQLDAPSVNVNNTAPTLVSLKDELGEQFSYGASTLAQIPSVLAPLPLSIISDVLNLGLPGSTFTSYTTVTSNGKTPQGEGRAAFGGSLNLQIADNAAEAWIGEGATIVSGASVNVDAEATVQTINVGGMSSLIFFFKDKTFGGVASDGLAIGATFNGLLYDNSANAWVGDGASITAIEHVRVAADAEAFVLNFTQSGGAGGGAALGASISLQDVDNEAVAHIEETANVNAGGDLIVEADGRVRAIGFTFTNENGGAAAIGASIVVNDYDTITKAFIGDDRESTAFTALGTLRAGGDIRVDAENDELFIAMSFAGAKAEGAETEPTKTSTAAGLSDLVNESGQKDQATNPSSIASGAVNGAGGASGQVSADVLLDRLGESTGPLPKGKLESLKETVTDKLGAIKSKIRPAEGTTPAPPKERTAGVGVSGDLAVNLIEGETRAFIGDGLTVVADADRGTATDDGLGGDLSVIAENDAYLIGTTIGLAIGGKQKGAAIAGSAAFNLISRDTAASIGENANVRADRVTVSADSDDLHVTITAGGGGAATDAATGGVAGSVNVHVVENDTKAAVDDGATVLARGDVVVEADNQVRIASVAGAIGVAGNAGIGAAADVVVIDDRADALIGSNASVQTGGDVVISADNRQDVFSLAGSLGIGTKKLGVGGSGMLQLVIAEADAEIGGGATVLANGSIWVDANDRTRLIGISGGGAGGKDGFGAGISGQITVRDVESSIGAGATVTALGRGDALVDPAGSSNEAKGLVVEATSEDGYITYGGSGAIASEAGFAASWVPVIVASDTDAWIGDLASINVNPGPNDPSINPTSIPTADFGQSVRVRADHDLRLSSATGSLGVGKSTVGVGASLTSAFLIRNARASIGEGATVVAENHVEVLAESEARVISIASAGAGAGGGAGAGTVAGFVIGGNTTAKIEPNAVVAADGNVVVSAINDAQVLSLAGEATFGKSAGAGVTAAAVISVNFVEAAVENGATVTARGDRGFSDVPNGDRESPVEGPETDPTKGLAVTAVSFEDFVSISAGANVGLNAGVTGSLAASLSFGSIEASVEPGAKINPLQPSEPDATPTGLTQDVRVLASDKLNALQVAGALAGSTTAGVGAAVGSALIVRNVRAEIDGASVRARDLSVRAESDEIMITGSFGATVAASTGGEPPAPPDDTDALDGDSLAILFNEVPVSATEAITNNFAGSASVAGHVVVKNVEAEIIDSAVRADGAVEVIASDETTLAAGSGGVAVSATNTAGGAGGGAAGAGLSANVLTSLVEARVDSTDLSARGDVTIEAESVPLLIAAALAGSVDVSGNEGGGTIGTGAGAVAVNAVVSSISAAVEGASRIESLEGDVSLSAEDKSRGAAPTMVAVAGAMTVGGIGGTDAATALDFGAAIAVDNVTSLVEASIDGSTVISAGDLSLSAESDAHIDAGAVGLGGTVTAGTAGGTTLTLVGSATVNAVTSVIEASVVDSSLTVGGGLSLNAQDDTIIGSGAGGATVSAGLGAGEGTATAVQASATINAVTSVVEARIENASGTVADDVLLDASADSDVFAAALAGAGAGTGGAGGGNAGAGGGALAINAVNRSIEAEIVSGSVLSAGGDARLSATDESTIIAAVGSLTLAIAGGAGGGNTGAVGASIAINEATNRAEATIDGSTVSASGAVSLSAESDVKISVATVGLAGGGTTGGGEGASITAAGSGSVNVVVGLVEASIRSSDVDAGQSVNLTAADRVFVIGGAGGAAAAGSGGGGSGSAGAVGASVVVNTVVSDVEAAIDDSDVTSGGDVVLEADGAAYIYAAALAGSGAGTGSGGAGGAFAAVGAGVINAVVHSVSASIEDASDVQASRDVRLSATDRSQVISAVGSGTIAAVGGSVGNAGAIGASIAITNLTNFVDATIDASEVSAGRDVSLVADYGRPDGTVIWPDLDFTFPALEANVVSVAIGLSGGGSGGSGATTVAAVGSGVATVIVGEVEAIINESTVAAGRDLLLSATDDSAIAAGAGTVSIGVAAGSGGLANAFAGSLVASSIATKTVARIDSSETTSGQAVLKATSTSDLFGAAAAGTGAISGSSAGSAISAAGAGIVHIVVSEVAAEIVDGSEVSATAGSVTMTATDSSQIIAAVGAVSVSVVGGSAGNAAAFGASLAFNTVTKSTTAGVDHSAVNASGIVLASARSETEIYSSTLGLSGGGTGGQGALAITGVGSGSLNVIVNDVDASIRSSQVVSGLGAILTARDDSLIGAGAGGAGISVAAGGGGVQISVGTSIASNTIAGSVVAAVEDSSIESPGSVIMTAQANSQAFAGAIFVSGGGAGGGEVGVSVNAAGAAAVNVVVRTVAAEVVDGSAIEIDGVLSLSARDQTTIAAAAGQGTLALGFGEVGVAVGLGASLASNVVNETVRASITDSTANVGATLSLSAKSEIDAHSAAIGGAGAGAGGGVGGVSVSAAGSMAFNVATGRVSSTIERSATTSGSGTSLLATDDATLSAGSGGAAAGGSGGEVGGVNVAAAGSFAANVVVASVESLILGSSVTATGRISLDAISSTRTLAAALAGAGGGAGGAVGGVTVSGAGAFSTNTIATTVRARIAEGSRVESTGGSVALSATKASHLPGSSDPVGSFSVIAAAGTLTAAGSGGGVGGVNVSLGASFAENQIVNTIVAEIGRDLGPSATAPDSVVKGAGDVSLSARSTASISAAAAGGGGSGAGGAIGGVDILFVGSGTGNGIANTVRAAIRSSEVSAGDDVGLFASDDSLIGSGAGGAAINGAGGAIGGVTIAGAASVAVNVITNDVDALIDRSSIIANDSVDLFATSSAEIVTAVFAGAGTGSGGVVTGVSIGGAGAGAINLIRNDVEAIVRRSDVETSFGDVSVFATDSSSVKAGAGSGTFAGAGAIVGVTVTVGAAYAINEIDDRVIASVVDSTIDAGDDLFVSASSSADIRAFANGLGLTLTGGIVSVSVAASGSVTVNEIDGSTEASVSRSQVETGGDVLVRAVENASILSNAGVGAVSVNAAGLPIAATFNAAVSVNSIHRFGSSNTIPGGPADETSNSVAAFIEDAVVAAGGSVTVQADSSSSIESITAAGSVNLAIGVGGAFAGDAVAAVSRNEIGGFVQAFILDSTVEAAGALAVLSDRSDTARAISAAGQLQIAASVFANVTVNVGAAVAINDVIGIAGATIDGSSIDAGALNVSAATDFDLDALAVAAAVSANVSLFNFSFSAAGASAVNRVLGAPVANVSGSSIVARVRPGVSGANGNARVAAVDRSSLNADVGSGALAINLALVPVNASVGVSIAENRLNESGARAVSLVETSNIRLDGDLTLLAETEATLDAFAVATSVSVSAGAAGAGANALSKVGTGAAAELRPGTTIVATGPGDDVSVIAKADARAAARAAGGAASFAAAGATVATAEVTGERSALVDRANVTASHILIQADSDGRADADATAAAGGVFAAVANSAEATFSPTVAATVGSDTILTGAGGVTLDAKSRGAADATAFGAVVGVVAVGVNRAEANVSPTVTASTGSRSSLRSPAGGVRILASHNADSVTHGTVGGLGATAAAGASRPSQSIIDDFLQGNLSIGVFAGTGATANAVSSAFTSSRVGADSSLNALDRVEVFADSYNDSNAVANAATLGVIGIGAISANARSGGDTVSNLGDGANLLVTGGSVSILAGARNDAEADASASTLGVATGAGADADADVGVLRSDSRLAPTDPRRSGSGDLAPLQVRSVVGVDATIDARINVTVSANSSADADADARGTTVGLLAVGVSQADSRTFADVDALVDRDASVTARGLLFSVVGPPILIGGDVTISAAGPSGGSQPHRSAARASASGGGLISGIGSRARSELETTSDASLGDRVSLFAADDLLVRSAKFNDSDAESNAATFGVIGVGASLAEARSRGGATRATIGNDARIDVDGSMVVEADGSERLESDAVAAAGGLLTGFGTDSTAIASGVVTEATVGDRGIIEVGRSVQVDADFSSNLYASARGVQETVFLLNAAKVGYSYAESDINASVTSRIGTDTTGVIGTVVNAGDDVQIIARRSFDVNRAEADASLGGDLIAFLGVGNSVARATSFLQSTAYLGRNSNLDAGGSVTVTADSGSVEPIARASNRVTSSLGTFIAKGDSDAVASGDVRTSAELKAGATARADGDFTLRSVTDVTTASYAVDTGGGLVASDAFASARTQLRHRTAASVGDGASVLVGGAIDVSADSDIDATSSARVDVEGLSFASFPKAVAITTVTDGRVKPSSIRDENAVSDAQIQSGQENDTLVSVGNGARLEGRSVNLTSDASDLDATAYAEVDAGPSVVSDLDAIAEVAAVSFSGVSVGSASLIGTDSVRLTARHGSFRTDTRADAHLHTAVDVDTDAEIDVIHFTRSDVFTSGNSSIRTRSLRVSSDVDDQTFTIFTDDHTSLPGGDRRTYTRALSQTAMNFNSDVVVTQPDAVAIIGPTGAVLEAQGLTVLTSGGAIYVSGVNGVGLGDVEFSMYNDLPAVLDDDDLDLFSRARQVAGDPDITFLTTPTRVRIENQSNLNLFLDDLIALPNTSGAVIRFVRDLQPAYFDPTFLFFPSSNSLISNLVAPNVPSSFPTVGAPPQPFFTTNTSGVHFQSLLDVGAEITVDSLGSGLVLLAGHIENPNGSVVVNSRGSILNGGSIQQITARDVRLNATATGASIGSTTSPIFIASVDSNAEDASISAVARGSIDLILQPTAAGFATLELGPIRAGTRAGIRVLEGIDGSGSPRPAFVDVYEITAGQDLDLQVDRGLATLRNNGGIPGSNAGLTSTSGTVSVGVLDGVLTDGGFSFVDQSLITAPRAVIFATIGIGFGGISSRLPIAVDRLEAVSNGSVLIENARSLTIGGVSSIRSGVLGGGVDIVAAGAIVVEEQVRSASGSVTLSAIDGRNAGDDVVLLAGSSILSADDVEIRAGDDIRTDVGSTITAADRVILRGAFGNIESGVGSTINHSGNVFAPRVDVLGGADADTIRVKNVQPSSVTLIDAGGGDDLVELGADASGDPAVGRILATTTVQGGAGDDTIKGPFSANVWTMTSLGSGDVSGVNPFAFNTFENLIGNTQTDRFVVGAGVSGRIDGGLGADTLDYSTFSTPVVVNLATGVAPNVGMGVAGIESVLGGSTNDLLTSGPDSALLFGGAGDDAIVGADLQAGQTFDGGTESAGGDLVEIVLSIAQFDALKNAGLLATLADYVNAPAGKDRSFVATGVNFRVLNFERAKLTLPGLGVLNVGAVATSADYLVRKDATGLLLQVYRETDGSTAADRGFQTVDDSLPSGLNAPSVVSGRTVTKVLEVPFQSVAGLSLLGSAADFDSVTIDFGNGDPLPPATTFDGGLGVGDAIILRGGASSDANKSLDLFRLALESPTAGTGVIEIDGGKTVTFIGAETVQNTTPTAAAEILGSAGDDTVNLNTASAPFTSNISFNGVFDATLATPSTSLLIDGRGGIDDITSVDVIDLGAASLTLVGEPITVRKSLSVGAFSANAAGAFTLIDTPGTVNRILARSSGGITITTSAGGAVAINSLLESAFDVVINAAGAVNVNKSSASPLAIKSGRNVRIETDVKNITIDSAIEALAGEFKADTRGAATIRVVSKLRADTYTFVGNTVVGNNGDIEFRVASPRTQMNVTGDLTFTGSGGITITDAGMPRGTAAYDLVKVTKNLITGPKVKKPSGFNVTTTSKAVRLSRP